MADPGRGGSAEPVTVTWRQLWSETAAVIDDPATTSQRHGQAGHRTRAVARWLCEGASGADGDEFLEILDEPATQRAVHALDAMVARLRAGEPLQYVLGRWAFRHLDLMIDRRVLIPRPETEQVVDVALRAARQLRTVGRRLLVADLGTGSGAIGLSLAHELPIDAAEIWLTDVSPDALDVARANCAGVGRNAACVRTALGSWLDALPRGREGEFDLIVSNPPYVGDDDADLDDGVRDWEPQLALFGGGSGLDATRVIARDALQWLRPGGVLVLEISARSGRDVAGLLREAGYVDVLVTCDLAGADRVAQAKRAAT
jgi:release factor glutamine methyltransferase